MAEVEPGKKYLGVTCRKCGLPTPFIETDQETHVTGGEGYFEIQCSRPDCLHTDRYQPSELHMMEAHIKQ